MFKRILVAVDGSATAHRGLKAAVALAKDQAAALDIVHVIDEAAMIPYLGDSAYVPAEYIEAMLEDLRKTGNAVLAKALKEAREAGVSATPALVESRGSTVAHAILRQARRLRPDVIVLGTHGRRGLRRFVMGSDAETVLRESSVPVLLVRPRGRLGATATDLPRAVASRAAAARKAANTERSATSP